MVLSLCARLHVQNSPFYKDIRYIGLGPHRTLLRPNLNLTNHIYKDPIPMWGSGPEDLSEFCRDMTPPITGQGQLLGLGVSYSQVHQ